MSQSNVIAGAIFVAFFLYITAKGELGTYLGFFVTSGNKAGAGTVGANPIGGAVGAANAAGQWVNQAVTSSPGIAFGGLGESASGTAEAIGAIGGYGGE